MEGEGGQAEVLEVGCQAADGGDGVAEDEGALVGVEEEEGIEEEILCGC